MAKRQPFYDDDLAYIHHVGFSDLIEGWTPGLLQILRKAGISDGVVVDLGCGGGVWAQHLVKAGYRPIGIDCSPAMIELAREHAPRGDFQVASIWDCSLPTCRAVTALSEVVCYRDGRSRPNLQSFLRRVFGSLESGGLLIFDVAEIGLGRGKERTFAEGTDWACMVRYECDQRRDLFTRHITTFRQQGKQYRRSQERHIVQLYDGRAVSELLRKVGFRVRRVRAFGSYPLLSKRLGFIARKP